MKIEVLGTGCAKCKTLYENAVKAVEVSGKSAEVVKIEDIPTIMKYGAEHPCPRSRRHPQVFRQGGFGRRDRIHAVTAGATPPGGDDMREIVATVAVFLTFSGIARAELPSATGSEIARALASGKPALIDIGARTCNQCRNMAPVLESLATEYRGKASVLFIDAHEDPTAAGKFRVQMIPTQIFFDGKGKEVQRHVGSLEKAELVRELKAAGLR
jgi:thioredoxin 1